MDPGKLLSALRGKVCAECFGKIFREINESLRETQEALEEKRKELLERGLSYQRATLDEMIADRADTVADLRELRRELYAALGQLPPRFPG